MVKSVIKDTTDEELKSSETFKKALETREEDIKVMEHLRDTRGRREKEEETTKNLGLYL